VRVAVVYADVQHGLKGLARYRGRMSNSRVHGQLACPCHALADKPPVAPPAAVPHFLARPGLKTHGSPPCRRPEGAGILLDSAARLNDGQQ